MKLREMPGVRRPEDLWDRRRVIRDGNLPLGRLLELPPEERPHHLSLVSGLDDPAYQAHAGERVDALEHAVRDSDLPGDRARKKLWFHRNHNHQTLASWGPVPGPSHEPSSAVIGAIEACFGSHAKKLLGVDTHGHEPELARSGINLRTILRTDHERTLDAFLENLEQSGASTQRGRGLTTSIVRYRSIRHIGLWHRMMLFFGDYEETPHPPPVRFPLLPLQLVVLDKLGESVRVVLRLGDD